jgi:hypothetical protein
MRTFSTFALATLRAGALVCVVLLLSGLGLAQTVVTARAAIPFNFWAQDHEFQAGDYIFNNQSQVQLRSTVKEQIQVLGLNHPLCRTGGKRKSQSDLRTSRRKVLSS